jgi:hypothetical protein
LWVRRREALVSEGLATFVAVIALLMGVGLGMAIVTGGDATFACLEKGNAADWVAAAGTWVIGFAAAWVAYIAHKRNERELDSASRRRQEEVISLRALASTQLMNAYGLADPLTEFIAAEASERTVKRLRRLIALIERDAQPVTIGSDVMAAIPVDSVIDIKTINNNLEFIRDLTLILSDSIGSRAKNHDDDLSHDIDLDVIKAAKKYADEIEARCLAFFEMASHP